MTVKTKKSLSRPANRSIKNQSPRQLGHPRYNSFRLQKRIKSQKPKLTNAPKLFGRSIGHLWKRKRLYSLIILIYLLLSIVLVKGLAGTADISELKGTFDELLTGVAGQLTTGLTLFGLLLGTVGTASNDAAGVYQTFLLILVSLVLIWTLRQTHAGEKVRVKEAFYKSAYPLIPFILILMVIGLQLLPLLLGGMLYSVVFEQGLAVNAFESVAWIVLIFLLIILSLYMVTSSLFALYIVTLPDLTPMKALRSARELVRYRRWSVMRKLLFLPIVFLVSGALIMVPIILWITLAAEFIFLALTVAAIAAAHSYIYSLYRELL